VREVVGEKGKGNEVEELKPGEVQWMGWNGTLAGRGRNPGVLGNKRRETPATVNNASGYDPWHHGHEVEQARPRENPREKKYQEVGKKKRSTS